MFVLPNKALPGSAAMRDRFHEGLRELKARGRCDRITADALAGEYAKSK